MTLRQLAPSDGSAGASVLEFCAGGLQGEGLVRLTQQNVIDLISPGLLAFANTGTLS
jgi:hypothetical protein